jgi:hypothetical protein
MTTRTRYFVITSLLVLFVGVGTGLVAYYVGFPGGVLASQAALEDLKMLPGNAQLVAFANVREVMRSELREKVRAALPIAGQGQLELADQTGINIETDIEQVIACLAPGSSDQALLVLARGTFETARIEGLMLQKGAKVEDYKGVRLIVAGPGPLGLGQTGDLQAINTFAVAFIAPGLAALGNTSLIRAAVDQRASGGPGLTGNAELMSLVRDFDGGHTWAVGNFAALASHTGLPAGLAGQLPAITWFAANAQVDSGVRATLRADTRDQEAADNLREIVRGFIALGRLQTASQPDLKAFLDSLTLGGSATTVSLTFDLPGQLIDRLASVAGHIPNGPRNGQ